MANYKHATQSLIPNPGGRQNLRPFENNVPLMGGQADRLRIREKIVNGSIGNDVVVGFYLYKRIARLPVGHAARHLSIATGPAFGCP